MKARKLRRPLEAVAFSGLAAGLSMGFSFVAEGLLNAYLPPTSWAPLVIKLGYPVGFLIVILGRQQLFTETTVTVVLPLLSRRTAATLTRVLEFWAVVLATNLLGALFFAWVLGATDAYGPLVKGQFAQLGFAALSPDFWGTVVRAVFAGWIIATVVWLQPVAAGSRVVVIIILTYLVGLANLSHIIAGSVETLYLVTTGHLSWVTWLGHFMAPTLLGNALGGVASWRPSTTPRPWPAGAAGPASLPEAGQRRPRAAAEPSSSGGRSASRRSARLPLLCSCRRMFTRARPSSARATSREPRRSG